MTASFIHMDDVISFDVYTEEIKRYNKDISQICSFFDSLSPIEDRFRWDLIQLLHLTLVAFLNSFGYDFQYTEKENIEKILNDSPRQSRLLANYKSVLVRNKLNKNEHIKSILSLIPTTSKKGSPWEEQERSAEKV